LSTRAKVFHLIIKATSCIGDLQGGSKV